MYSGKPWIYTKLEDLLFKPGVVGFFIHFDQSKGVDGS